MLATKNRSITLLSPTTSVLKVEDARDKKEVLLLILIGGGSTILRAMTTALQEHSGTSNTVLMLKLAQEIVQLMEFHLQIGIIPMEFIK